MKVIKEHKNLQLVKYDKPINGGLYAVVNSENKKAKNGLCLDAAIEVFNRCKIWL